MVEIFQNIRKIYDFRKPCQELIDYIEFYSQSNSAASDDIDKKGFSSVKMFPSWTPTIYINLGPSYYIDLNNKRYNIKKDDDILILRNGDVTRHKQASDNLFTIKFQPGGLERILGFNQVFIVDQIINLNHILPQILIKQLKQQITFEERVLLIESYLLEAFNHRNNGDHYLKIVRDCIVEYQGAGMQLNTTQVAERIFITSKTINRYFNRVIGTSPKAFLSILRSRNALTAFVANKAHFNPLDYGYYDLSHFHKDIVSLTGKSLKKHNL